MHVSSFKITFIDIKTSKIMKNPMCICALFDKYLKQNKPSFGLTLWVFSIEEKK